MVWNGLIKPGDHSIYFFDILSVSFFSEHAWTDQPLCLVIIIKL